MNKKIWAIVAMLGLMYIVFLQMDIEASPQIQEKELNLKQPNLTQQLAFIAFLNTIDDAHDTKLIAIRQHEATHIPLYNLQEIRKPIDFIIQQETVEPQKKPDEVVHEKKKIALTFDDGPHPVVTEKILAVLLQNDIKATFFVLGQNVGKYPQIVNQAAKQGHEIANHSWSHANFTKLSGTQITAELEQTNEVIYKASGKYPNLYRPPYGATNANVRGQTSMEAVMWSVDTMDWKHRTPEKTLAYVKEQVKDNGIILMHDIHSETADSLEAVINYLIEQDYEFVTASELLKLQS
ncbi:MAG: polysaccharide deacetylase family protein [Solibacillus sp.]